VYGKNWGVPVRVVFYDCGQWGKLAVGAESSNAKISLVSSWCTRPGDVYMSSHDPNSALVPFCCAGGMSVARSEEHPWPLAGLEEHGVL